MGGMRGTSNTNSRGSAESRRRRKAWLASPASGFGGDGTSVQCQFDGCETMVTVEDMWVDRYPIPGCAGGRYVRGNIRPSCSACNMSHGGGLGHQMALAPEGVLTVPTAGSTVVLMNDDETGTVAEAWTLGTQRYARTAQAKRQWKWGATVTHNADSQWLPGYSTKREAVAAGQAWLRARGVTTP